jgi:hyperosmotically inducible protein
MDEQISTSIRSRFAADADLSAQGLRVDTRQGVVTLRGTVASFAQRDRAIRLAEDVRGVQRVDSQININTK